MKTRNLFLSLFAFAAICACNKEAQPEVPQVLGEDAYLNVRIMAADVNTKADDGGFQVGSSEENLVHNVLFAFFSADGSFMYTRNKSFSWNAVDETNPNIEKKSSAVVVLDGKTIAPRQMVVVLNYDQALQDAVDDVTSITEMYNVLTTASYALETNTKFLMTNSSYANGTTNAFAAQISDANIYTMSEKPDGQTDEEYRASKTPVDVYVERVAAKLSVVTSASLDRESKSLELHNGSTILYYPDIVGYAFTGTKDASYLCKNIEGVYTKFNTPWPEWNDPTNKRSYWGVSYPSATSKYVDYDAVTKGSGHFEYCHENMTTAKTKLMVKAVIRKQKGANQDPATDPVLSLVKVGATYYIQSELEEAIAGELTTAGVRWNDTSIDPAEEKDYAVGDFKYTPIEGGTGYEVKIELENPPINTSAAETVMSKYAKVVLWNEGQCYFSTKVEHLGKATTDPASDYGVVRNHVYNLSVNKIAGLGTPYVPGIGGDGGDPVVPSDVDYELQARINILKWKVVSQDVSFGDE